MAVQTKIEKTIPRIYRRSALRQLMFGFVRGTRSALPTITIKEAIRMFMEDFGLDDETFNLDSALVIYNDMQSELINLKRKQ